MPLLLFHRAVGFKTLQQTFLEKDSPLEIRDIVIKTQWCDGVISKIAKAL